MMDITVAAIVCLAVIVLAGLAGIITILYWNNKEE